MVLGNWSRENTMYGTEGFSVIGNGDLAEQLQTAIGRLPRFEPLQATPATPAAVFTPPPPERHITEGSFFLGEDGTIRQVDRRPRRPIVYRGNKTVTDYGTMMAGALAAFIRLKAMPAAFSSLRTKAGPNLTARGPPGLNSAYDRFTRLYGPINKTTFSEDQRRHGHPPDAQPGPFQQDPDAMLVMSLEDYDEATGKAEKAAIMRRDVVGRKPPVTHVSSAEEGLLVSLNERGAVDLPFISGLYGKPETQIIAELGDLIFKNPESKTWQTADAYLSGNVRAKLKTAEAAGAEYARNAEALRSGAAGGRAARRHRRQSRRAVDTGERHPGLRRPALRRWPGRDPGRPPGQGRGVEP